MNKLFEKKYEFDIFISYREDTTKNSCELAEKIANLYKSTGYKVFFDQWFIGKVSWKQAIDKSRNYVIILTDYSFDKDNEPYNKEKFKDITEFTERETMTRYLKDILKYDKTKNGNGLKEEVINICEIIFDEWHKLGNDVRKYDEVKNRVKLLNIDKKFPTKEPFELLVEAFLMKSFNYEPLYPKKYTLGLKNGFTEYSKGFHERPRVKLKRLCKKWSAWLTIFALVATTALVWCIKHYDDKIEMYSDSLAHYDELLNETPIVFVGGGTVKNYLLDKGLDLNNYKPGVYIHLPSVSAWSVLLDDPNDSSCYSPVVISTGEIDESELDSTQVSHFKDKGRRILQYYFARIPLIVQLRNYRGPEYKNGTITVDELKGLLNNKKYILYATSPQSGTKKAYLFFDNSLNKFIGPVKNVFRPESYDQNDLKHTQIYFANELYCVPPDTNVISLKLCKGIDTASVGLYLYVVGAFDAKTGRYELDASVRKCMEWLNIFVGDSKLEQPSEEKGNLIIPLN